MIEQYGKLLETKEQRTIGEHPERAPYPAAS
jgi:hypothetical protein